MRHTFGFGIGVGLSLLSGCASIQRNGESDGFQRALTELRQKHKPTNRLIGTVPFEYVSFAPPPTFRAVGIPAPDFDDIEQRKTLGFVRASEQEICFVFFELLEWNDAGNLRKEDEPDFIAARRKRVESGEFYVEAFDSLVEVPSRAVLPPSGAQRLSVRTGEMGLDVKYTERKVIDLQGNARIRRDRSSQKQMTYELCGPTPPVTPSTRYFTVAQKFKEATINDIYSHFLYVFARQDEGEPSLDLRGGDGSPPPTSQPTGARPEPSQNSPTPSSATPEATTAKPAPKMRSSTFMSVPGSVFGAATKLRVTFLSPMKAAPGEKFWLTITRPSAGSTDYTTSRYLDPDATSVEIDLPGSAGDFELRLHGNYPTKTYNLIDRLKVRTTTGEPSSEPDPNFPDVSAAAMGPDKGAKSKMMALANVRINPLATFTVKFPKALKPKKSEKFWIAICTPGSPETEYLSYQYVEDPKSIDLPAPDLGGEYELRLHGNYPTKKTNVVDRLKFTVK